MQLVKSCQVDNLDKQGTASGTRDIVITSEIQQTSYNEDVNPTKELEWCCFRINQLSEVHSFIVRNSLCRKEVNEKKVISPFNLRSNERGRLSITSPIQQLLPSL